MGCTCTRNEVAPMITSNVCDDKTHTSQECHDVTYIKLSSEKHIKHLYECGEICKKRSEVLEPKLKEIRERKLREFADNLENPNFPVVPKERFIAF